MAEKLSFSAVIDEELVNKKKIFVAHCTELGIASQGRTVEEAIKNIKEAVSLYLEECPEEEGVLKQEKNLIQPLVTRIFL